MASPQRASAAENTRYQLNLKNVPVDVLSAMASRADQQRCSITAMWIQAARALLDAAENPPAQLTLPFGEAARAASSPRPNFGFRFIDLFAGIGGFRIALERLGGSCVFSSEWDKQAQRTYLRWFGELPHGDITKIAPASLPGHDLLAAGFPCQPFSLAGVSKKNALGHAHGFACKRQGNLFFSICDIVRALRPPALLLENVKNLRSHDAGRTWAVIRDTLERELGYEVNASVLDAAHYVPQHRERIFIVCFNRELLGGEPSGFVFPEAPNRRPKLLDILDPSPDAKYTLTDHLWTYLQRYARKHAAKGNGFGFGLVSPGSDPDVVTRTLSARYYKDGSEILVDQGANRTPRRLTPVECARLMGFEAKVRDRADIPVSDTQAYRQFGNAVVPAVVEAVAAEALRVLDRLRLASSNGAAIPPRPRPRARRSAPAA
ncbi:MAG TPA: DNA (cytosine-5-)-methyltransferase [Phycisphaerales bacterium]|nr:DNA (cytosine-5-)-methyltransferase [Phycisphaerales bacterium]HMP36471.1 DNA (cytosine-5-)-methyltransferase [Phycisphaerales bacterium]